MYVWMTRIRSAVLPRRARGLCSCVVLEECNFSVSEMKNRRGTVYVHVCVAASGIARQCARGIVRPPRATSCCSYSCVGMFS